MFLLLFVGVVGARIVYFTRFDPKKEELTHKSYNIGCLAMMIFLLLAFLLPFVSSP